jgi:predicted SAM-dependent methyltransferase
MASWHVDQFYYFGGFVWVTGWISREQPICRLIALFPNGDARPLSGDLAMPSPDVEAVCGQAGRNSRFGCHVAVSTSEDALNLRIMVETNSGTQAELEGFRSLLLATDVYHALQAKFYSMLSPQAGRVLELGSRNRSGVLRKGLIPDHLEYVGVDILQGENVDLVGDAHELSRLFPPESFDAVFATSVFEHLMMPWKVVIELNHILKQDGLVMLTSHQSWPLHEMPWDYWRFSDQAWYALFNSATGFEIIETALGERCSIVPHALHAVTLDLDRQPAFCGSAVLCRKIGSTKLEWNVGIRDLTKTIYPA